MTDECADVSATLAESRPQSAAGLAVRAANEAAAAASLQRLANEASLEAHGYEPVRRLSGSTTATVMIVQRLGIAEEHFVVKTMALRGLDTQERVRALKEIQILKSLRHENIIEYIENWWIGTGPDSGRLTVVMECADNGDLRAPVQAALAGGKPVEEVLIMSWLQQVLQGLEYVHKKNIIHRDLKAMNIFLKDTWQVCKLGDFGISTALKGSASTSGCVGTPSYMAPELVWNQRYASAVDMWAVGIVLYELMALKLPFQGTSLLALVYQIAFNELDAAPLHAADYSEELISLVVRLLNKEPNKRPSATELLSEDLLWDAFSDEAARGFALASFSKTISSPSGFFTASAALQEEADNVMGSSAAIADAGKVAMDTGTGSDWGDAFALSSSAATMEEGLYLDGAPASAAGEFSASLATQVSDLQLWEELRKTRSESDMVLPERFEELLRSIQSCPPEEAKCERGEVGSHLCGIAGAAPAQEPASEDCDLPENSVLGPPPVEEARPMSAAVSGFEAVRAANDAAAAASLQRFANEASLEAHGYEPVRRLSGSTTATVVIVQRLGLPDEHFVVKTMAMRGLEAQQRMRALKEIQILKSLRHESIIRYIESWWTGAGPDSGRLTLVMECAENGDLRVPVQAAIQGGKNLEEVLIMSWLQQMLSGLSYVHKKNIIHRDLKAMNIFLKDTWQICKLGDFGISSDLKGSDATSGCVGTPAYMAPELVWNQRYASAVDMWAVGIVLFELMALRLPFRGTSLLALVYQIAFNVLDDSPLRDAGYSQELISLVIRLLKKEPGERPSAADLLSEDLLWDAFSDEVARGFALASFSATISSPGGFFKAPTLDEEADRNMGIKRSEGVGASASAALLHQASGTGSDWGDAIALGTSGADGMAPDLLDSITGEPTAIQDSPTVNSVLATAVSDHQLWEELRKTRHESDTVQQGRLEALLAGLQRSVVQEQGSDTEHPEPGDCPEPGEGAENTSEQLGTETHDEDGASKDEDSHALVARVGLFLKRRGIH
eukprot:TRINITY_DN61050_c0_g1_i2.p1 TRINITY_DN61050_c0_g1~~TRINITY_DN61050_c0_g1_i2.p1  ORF type:complete len:1015 (+),score=221.59 TRINITY_DN61050_c0_g1_i2:117-3161(+)